MDINFLQLQSGLNNLCFLVSFLITIYYWAKIIFFSQSNSFRFGFFGFCSINIFLAIQLILRWIESSHFPLSTLYESLLFLCWSITFIYLILENFLKVEYTGVLISPLVLCILGFTGFSLPGDLQLSKPLVPALQSNWLFMHVSVMMLSYAGLLIGSLFALAYLIMENFFLKTISNNQSLNLTVSSTSETFPEKTVKTKDFLQIFDNLSYRTIGIGFCFLTLGILSGAVWANETWGSYWSWDPKETWALITWIIFACYLHARLVYGWQGLRPAQIASFGFVLIWICYLGVNLLGKGLHTYGFLNFISLTLNFF